MGQEKKDPNVLLIDLIFLKMKTFWYSRIKMVKLGFWRLSS
jgi:hypothetical protein